MILLNNSGGNRIYIPKHVHDDGNIYSLWFKSEVTGREYVANGVIDLGIMTDFYEFQIDTYNGVEPEPMPDGEYVYTLTIHEQHNIVRGKGLLRIGDFTTNTTKYTEQVIYRQYEY